MTWCLAWDPKARPTCSQAMSHEYFSDAFDPLRPKSSGSKLLGRKHSSVYESGNSDSSQTLSSKTSSWFRRSLIARDSAPVVPQAVHHDQPISLASPTVSHTKQEISIDHQMSIERNRPTASKRNTWANGGYNSGAPMPILPSIRPISPLSNAVTAQAQPGVQAPNGPYQRSQQQLPQQKPPKKIGRQLSQASQGNHYADTHRQEAEKALNGRGGLVSPTSSQKESFFSHLRKRARRLSGRHQLPMSPKVDDVEANAGCSPWPNGRSSVTDGVPGQTTTSSTGNFTDLDHALQNVRYSLDATVNAPAAENATVKPPQRVASNPTLKRHQSLPHAQVGASSSSTSGLHPSRSTRRAAQKPALGSNQYEAPDEQEELLDEALNSAQAAMMQLDRQQDHVRHSQDLTPIAQMRPRAQQVAMDSVPYPTPSPSAKRNSVIFGNVDQNAQPSKPIDIHQTKQPHHGTAFPFPTPPDENEWAAAAAASMGLSDQWRR